MEHLGSRRTGCRRRGRAARLRGAHRQRPRTPGPPTRTPSRVRTQCAGALRRVRPLRRPRAGASGLADGRPPRKCDPHSRRDVAHRAQRRWLGDRRSRRHRVLASARGARPALQPDRRRESPRPLEEPDLARHLREPGARLGPPRRPREPPLPRAVVDAGIRPEPPLRSSPSLEGLQGTSSSVARASEIHGA
jgi:hypothetical protein